MDAETEQVVSRTIPIVPAVKLAEQDIAQQVPVRCTHKDCMRDQPCMHKRCWFPGAGE